MSQRRAVITGLGPITCIGTGAKIFGTAILAEKSGINSISSFDPSVFRVRCGGEIRDWDPGGVFSAASSETTRSLRAVRGRLGEAGAR